MIPQERPSSGRQWLRSSHGFDEMPERQEQMNMADEKVIEAVPKASVQMIVERTKYGDSGCESDVTERREMAGTKVTLEKLDHMRSSSSARILERVITRFLSASE